jgi:hypothetical protein
MNYPENLMLDTSVKNIFTSDHRMYAGKFDKMFWVYVIIIFSIQGNDMMRAIKTATILGTKTNVISWICVTAWKILMASPITRPISSIGADIKRVTLMVSTAIPITKSLDITNIL